MIRRIARLLCVAAAACVAGCAGQQSTPRLSQNAALQYYQAFTFLPANEEFLKPIRNWKTAPLARLTLGYTDSPALRLIRLGAAMPEADWGLDMLEAGPVTTVNYLSPARDLSSLACLDGRVQIESGRGLAGIDDAIASMRLGHHVGASVSIMGTGVEHAIQLQTCGLLADEMARLKPEELSVLRRRWAHLPPVTTMAEAVERERLWTVGWAKRMAASGSLEKVTQQVSMALSPVLAIRDDEKPIVSNTPSKPVQNSAKPVQNVLPIDNATLARLPADLDQRYELMINAMQRPWQDGAHDDAEIKNQMKQTGSPLARALVGGLPVLHHWRFVECRTVACRAMVDAAAVWLHGGEAEFRTVRDPFGGGPFGMKKTAAGFELSSGLADKGKVVTLEFVAAAGR